MTTSPLESHRYAAFAEEFFDGKRAGGMVALCESQSDALAVLGDSVLDCFAPDRVYDLESGDKIEVHVSPPK